MRRIIGGFLVGLFLLVNASGVYAAEQYIVKSGDSLWNIANRNGTTVDNIMSINGLASDRLVPGQVLQLSSDTSSQPDDAVIESSQAQYYTVQNGDSLWKISQQFGVSVAKIKELNNLSSDFLQVGKQLVISNTVSTQVSPPEEKPVAAQVVQLSEEPSRGGNLADGKRVVQVAARYLGTPYRYGGTSPQGFDCSGFVQFIYKQFGYNLNRTAASQYQHGVWVDKASLLPGDMVFFSCGSASINHVGIYAGNNQFIHSSSPRSGGVIYSSLSEGYYARYYAGAKRILR